MRKRGYVPHFMGWVKGNRNPMRRYGSRGSGMTVKAVSRQGIVEVQLYTDGPVDMAKIMLHPYKGKGTEVLLFHGPVHGGTAELHGLPGGLTSSGPAAILPAPQP